MNPREFQFRGQLVEPDGPLDIDALVREIRMLREEIEPLRRRKNGDNGNGGNGNGKRSWDAFLRLAVPLLIAAVLGAAAMLMRHENDISVIQSNRFTAQDWSDERQELERTFRAEDNEIKARLRVLENGR